MGSVAAPNADLRLALALRALDDGSFDVAHAEFLALASQSPESSHSRMASLGLALVTLDPRNPDRDLAGGIGWLRQSMEAVEPAGVEAAMTWHAMRLLDRLSWEIEADAAERKSWMVRHHALETERDGLRRRVERLEQEIERIRRLLTP